MKASTRLAALPEFPDPGMSTPRNFLACQSAAQQQAKSYGLRAAVSLARLWGEQGWRAAARDPLTPGYGWFTEGFYAADLKDANALLAELA
jgi:hypothetical protein